MIKESVWAIGDVNPKCPFKITFEISMIFSIDYWYFTFSRNEYGETFISLIRIWGNFYFSIVTSGKINSLPK